MKEHNISLDLAAKTSRFNNMLHASNIKMNPENQNGFTLESRMNHHLHHYHLYYIRTHLEEKWRNI